MKKKTYNIGLFGFGTLGSSLYQLIRQSSLPLSIQKICIQDLQKNRGVSGCHFTTNKEDILGDEEIDIVVELINDDIAAFEIARESLEKGKCLVSANKKMIANNLSELHHIASKNNKSFHYEAAVCAAIPLIKSIDHHFQLGELSALRGIFNGSTNYILSAMHAEGLSFDNTLEQAIEKGFAEEDSWSDISGADPNYKSCILAYHSFGKIIKPEDTITRGIQGVSAIEMRIATKLGAKIKLVSTVENYQNDIHITTMPKLITSDDKLFSVDNEFNGVQLDSAYLGSQFYLGKGAGGYPSSGSVLADIVATLQNQTYFERLPIDSNYQQATSAEKYYYLRVQKDWDQSSAPGHMMMNLGEDEQYQWLVSSINASELNHLVKMLSDIDFIMEIPSEYLNNDVFTNAISKELVWVDGLS